MHFLSDKLSPPYFSGYTGLEIKETGDVKKRCITVTKDGHVYNYNTVYM